MRWDWTWHGATVAGIPIRVHWSFGLLPLLAVLRSLDDPAGWWVAALVGLATLAIVFGFVILHELGHALTARHLGVRVGDIILLPIGGLARMELRITPGWAVRELLITLAGPAVNLALALLLWPLAWLASGAPTWGPLAPLIVLGQGSPAGLLSLLWLSNLVLAAFNLLPIFPMDGGRVLRALLGLRLGYRRATRVAVLAGQTLGVALAVYGLLSGRLGMTLLALALVFAAGYELTTHTVEEEVWRG